MAYSVFLNGVYHGKASGKGAALDLAYGAVNTLQLTLASTARAHKGKPGIEATEQRAAEVSRLMGLLASTIPDARRSRCVERHVFSQSQGKESVSVRRD